MGAESITIEQFEDHLGPLMQGDLIVIDIGGKIIPRRPDDPRPQWFIVLENQVGDNPISLKPFNDHSALHRARIYRASWRI